MAQKVLLLQLKLENCNISHTFYQLKSLNASREAKFNEEDPGLLE